MKQNELSDANWQVLANVIGDGTTGVFADVVGASRRFWQVASLCS